MKKLTPHEKINLRAWFARISTGSVPSAFRIELPIRSLPKMAYSLTGRAASDLAGVQPPLVSQTAKPWPARQSDLTHYQRRRQYAPAMAS